MPDKINAQIEAACDQRLKFYESLGRVEPLVLSYLVNPALMGGPRWPAMRQGFLVIQRPNSTLFASHGLSDPFDDGSGECGFGVEMIAEVDEQVPFDQASSHWGFWLMNKSAQLAASTQPGQLAGLLEELGTISTELEGFTVPPAWLSPQKRAGVIFGVPAPDIPKTFKLPLGAVRLVTVKLLATSELALVLREGEKARAKLNDAFVANKSAHISSLKRKPVV